MPSTTPQDQDQVRQDSSGRWQRLHQALTRYLSARLQLLAEEARLAGRSIATAIAGFAIAAGLALVAYLLLVTSLVALLVHQLEWSVALAALVVGGAHLLLASLLALLAWASLRHCNKWFAHSINELAADREAFTRSDDSHPSP